MIINSFKIIGIGRKIRKNVVIVVDFDADAEVRGRSVVWAGAASGSDPPDSPIGFPLC